MEDALAPVESRSLPRALVRGAIVGAIVATAVIGLANLVSVSQGQGLMGPAELAAAWICSAFTALPVSAIFLVELVGRRYPPTLRRDLAVGAIAGSVALAGFLLGSFQAVYTVGAVSSRSIAGGLDLVRKFVGTYSDASAAGPLRVLLSVFALSAVPFAFLAVSRTRGYAARSQMARVSLQTAAVGVLYVPLNLIAFPWIIGDGKTLSLIVFVGFVAFIGALLPPAFGLSERIEQSVLAWHARLRS
jgi:hypothetical protein